MEGLINFFINLKDALLGSIWLWGKILFAFLVLIIILNYIRVRKNFESWIVEYTGQMIHSHPFRAAFSGSFSLEVGDYAESIWKIARRRMIIFTVVAGIVALASIVFSFLIPYLMKR